MNRRDFLKLVPVGAIALLAHQPTVIEAVNTGPKVVFVFIAKPKDHASPIANFYEHLGGTTWRCLIVNTDTKTMIEQPSLDYNAMDPTLQESMSEAIASNGTVFRVVKIS